MVDIMKNNKGFAITTMLYGLSIMGFLIVVLLMSIMSNNRSNTKEVVSNIEENLNRYSTTSTTLENNGDSFIVRPGESGVYKLELWGHNYRALTVYLEENTVLKFETSGSGTSLKSSIVLYSDANGTGTKNIISATDKCDIAGGIPGSAANTITYNQTTTAVVPATGNRKQVQVKLNIPSSSCSTASVPKPSTCYGNNQCIDNLNITKGKLFIKQLVKGKTFSYPSDFDSSSLAVNYYLMAVDLAKADGQKSNMALTLNPSNGNVSFQQFSGSKYQQWNIKKVGTTGKIFHITNTATGVALECNTETVNDMAAADDVIARNRLDNNNKYMQWESNGVSGPFYYCGKNNSSGARNCLILRPLSLNPAGYLENKGNSATFVGTAKQETKLYIQNAE